MLFRSVSIDSPSVGSEVGVASTAVSAVSAILDEVGVAGVVRVRWEEGELRFFDFLGVGRRGQECESCPTALHRGQAFSEPGHDAMTLNPSKSKNGDAESGDPAVTFKTMSQQLDWRGRPLNICGVIATTSPCAAQSFRSCCSTTSEANTGTLVSLMGTKSEGVPAGGTG